MKIINKESAGFSFFDRFLPDNQYYIIPLNDASDLNLTTEALDAINDGAKLLLSNVTEGFHTIIDPIYKFAINNSIETSNIWLVTGAADLQQHANLLAEYYNINPIKVVWYPIFFEGLIGRQANTLPMGPRSFPLKTYLSFNRRWRLHRPALVGLLHATNLLLKGYVSFDSIENQNWNIAWQQLMRSFHYHRCEEAFNLLVNNESEIKNLGSMFLDHSDLTVNYNYLEPSTYRYYDTSLISLVTETNFYTHPDYEGTRFLTEKTFKPIAHRQPFIMVSVPNTLKMLREMGYQTYGPFIDESYDAETNDNKRLLMITQEVKRLASLTTSQVEEFINNTQPIADKNFRKLLQRSILST